MDSPSIQKHLSLDNVTHLQHKNIYLWTMWLTFNTKTSIFGQCDSPSIQKHLSLDNVTHLQYKSIYLWTMWLTFNTKASTSGQSDSEAGAENSIPDASAFGKPPFDRPLPTFIARSGTVMTVIFSWKNNYDRYFFLCEIRFCENACSQHVYDVTLFKVKTVSVLIDIFQKIHFSKVKTASSSLILFSENTLFKVKTVSVLIDIFPEKIRF